MLAGGFHGFVYIELFCCCGECLQVSLPSALPHRCVYHSLVLDIDTLLLIDQLTLSILIISSIMKFATPLLAVSLVFGGASASSVLDEDAFFGTLMRRQELGTPKGNCHDNCGEYISLVWVVTVQCLT